MWQFFSQIDGLFVGAVIAVFLFIVWLISRMGGQVSRSEEHR